MPILIQQTDFLLTWHKTGQSLERMTKIKHAPDYSNNTAGCLSVRGLLIRASKWLAFETDVPSSLHRVPKWVNRLLKHKTRMAWQNRRSAVSPSRAHPHVGSKMPLDCLSIALTFILRVYRIPRTITMSSPPYALKRALRKVTQQRLHALSRQDVESQCKSRVSPRKRL